MSTITLPNFRTSADVTMRTRLSDGGVHIAWSDLTDIKAWLYSDAQKAIAGRCDVSISETDDTRLVCTYAASKPQYLGVNRLIVQAKYDGRTKTYDKPVFSFVRWTDEQEGEPITIDDPDIDVEIEVEDVSSSILDEVIRAALAAAERAEAAAEEAEADHRRAQDDHYTALADSTTAAEDHQRADRDSTTAFADHVQAERDHTTAAQDHALAAQDSVRANSDRVRADRDHENAYDDTVIASMDHSIAEEDHEFAETDHQQAESDHATAVADHERVDEAIEALYKRGVISQTITWTGSNEDGWTAVVSDPVFGPIPQANIDLYVAAGAVFNETSGYFEFNGLTDISYEEMLRIYNETVGLVPVLASKSTALTGYPHRTTLALKETASFAANNSYLCYGAINLVVIAFQGALLTTAANLSGIFMGCRSLRRVIGQIRIASGTGEIKPCVGCFSLQDIEIYNLRGNLELSDSSLLELDSVVFAVKNAANTTAITITLHATAYARCQADTTEYTYQGNTYTGILAYASAKNITIASA